MHLEILSTSNFLAHIIHLSTRLNTNQNVCERKLTHFQELLKTILYRRYHNNWFPEKPFKRSGYRCIRINTKMDPIIVEAGEKSGLSLQFLYQIFPTELTMWVDPQEVSYRIGENGNICILYEYGENGMEPWIPYSELNNGNTTTNLTSYFTEYIKKLKKIYGCREAFLNKVKQYLYKILIRQIGSIDNNALEIQKLLLDEEFRKKPKETKIKLIFEHKIFDDVSEDE